MRFKQSKSKVKGKSLLFIFGTIAISMVVVSFLFYFYSLKKEYFQDGFERLEEVANSNKAFVEKEVAQKKKLINTMSGTVKIYTPEDITDYIDGLVDEADNYGFARIGIINSSGKAYTTDNVFIDLGGEEIFTKSMRGITSLSYYEESKIDHKTAVTYSCPIYDDYGKVCASFCASYSAEQFAETISNPSFEGEGYSFITNSHNDILVASANADMEFVDRFIRTERVIDEESFRYEGNFIHVCSLSFNGWKLVTIVPESVMNTFMNSTMMRTYLLVGIVAIAIGIFLYVNWKTKKAKEDEIKSLSLVDEVTGGYSYLKFCKESERLLGDNGDKYVIVNADIDGFKLINNVYGYEAGNEFIRYMHRKIGENINITYQNEFYCHQLADKFIIAMQYYERSELEKRLRTLKDEISEYDFDGRRYPIHPVFGIYDVTDHYQDIRIMVDCAGIARKSIKGGINDVFFSYYDEKIKNRLIKDRKIENEMEDAIKNKEFCVYYQPKYSTIDGTIVGAEALVRWKKRDGSFVLPGDFLPLFENNGFVTTLDKYMFKEVCMAQRRWKDQGLGIVPVSVNLSRLHLHDTSFVKEYEHMVRESEVPANAMQLEITESAIFENSVVLKEVIDMLHDCGMTILMDDFGTGYSSMMMLKDISIDVLKLDKSFVEDIGNERGEKIISAIIKLAQALNIEVTAEGVEVKKQYDFLKAAGCDNIQGYYFAMPMPEYEYERLLKKTNETTE